MCRVCVGLHDIVEYDYKNIRLRGVADFKSWGVASWKRGNTSVPSYIRYVYLVCAFVRFAAVVLVLLGCLCIAGVFIKFRAGVGETFVCAGWNTSRHAHAPFRGRHKGTS